MDSLILQDLLKKDPHCKNGFYIYENKIYFSKIEALIEASKQKSDIRWYFNDDLFKTLDWGKEPIESLSTLYKQRAIQIRENFDHVILLFSGGADSTNMLRTFLENNIKLDSVLTFVAHNSHIDKKYERVNIEITLAAHPHLIETRKKGINVDFLNLLDYESPLEEDFFLEEPACRLAGDSRMRRNFLFDRPQIKKLVDQGKKVCYVMGIDKPRLRLLDNTWYLSFLDTWRAHHWPSQHKLTQGPFIEFFYFSPDYPKLLIKSCYEIINFFEKNWTKSQCNKLWEQEGNLSSAGVEVYDTVVRSVLYKNTWREGIDFSLGKNKGRFTPFICQKAEFLTKRAKDWSNFNNWTNGLNEMFSLLDHKFYKRWVAIIGHWSEKYPIKTINCSKS